MLIIIDVYWSSSLLKLIFEILHSMLCRCHVFPCNKQTILVQWILPPKSKNKSAPTHEVERGTSTKHA